MAQFKILRSGTEHLLETLGNTSQMKDLMAALMAIDANNGKEAGKDGWVDVKEKFEKFGFTVCYDRNLAIITVALFAAIAKSGCEDLKINAKNIINFKAVSHEGKSLGQAFLDGDGKAIYEILKHNNTFKGILAKIGIQDKYIKKYLDRMKKISPWRRTSKKVLDVVRQAFEDMADEDFLDEPTNSVRVDNKDSFPKDKNIDYVVIEGVEAIPNVAFDKFKKLQKVEIGKGVKDIGSAAFNECKALQAIIIGDDVEYIGSVAFAGTGLRRIKIPANVKQIADGAFQECDCLEHVTFLGSGIREISCRSFGDCTKLQEIKIPKGVTRIDKEAFWNCANLKKIEIPESVEEIERDAFFKCPKTMKILGKSKSDVRRKIQSQLKQIVANTPTGT